MGNAVESDTEEDVGPLFVSGAVGWEGSVFNSWRLFAIISRHDTAQWEKTCIGQRNARILASREYVSGRFGCRDKVNIATQMSASILLQGHGHRLIHPKTYEIKNVRMR